MVNNLFHHRISDRLLEKVGVEPGGPVSLRDDVVVVRIRRTQRSAFVHDVNHSGNQLPVKPYPDRFLSVQMRPALIPVERHLVGGSDFPYQNRNAAAAFLFNRSDRAVLSAAKPELIAVQLGNTGYLCRGAPVRHLFQIQIAAVCDI